MEDERREELRRRYLSLGWGEWCAACVFAYVAAFSLEGAVEALDATHAVWWALMPAFAVLIQAGAFWLSARSWVGMGRMPRYAARILLGLRVANAIVLVASLGAIALTWPDNAAGAILAVAVWLFAFAEFLNYFVVRLAYRPGSWWARVRQRRTPRLMIDVREGLAHPACSSDHD